MKRIVCPVCSAVLPIFNERLQCAHCGTFIGVEGNVVTFFQHSETPECNASIIGWKEIEYANEDKK